MPVCNNMVFADKRYPWQAVTRSQWKAAWSLRRKDGEAAQVASSFSWPFTVAWACESFRRGLPRFVDNTPRTGIFDDTNTERAAKLTPSLKRKDGPTCEVLQVLHYGQLRCGKPASNKFGGHYFCKEHNPS